MPSSLRAAPPLRARLEAARVACGLVFVLNGLAFASWTSRLPAVRAALGLSSSQLGLLLLCLSGGAVAALPTSGALVARVGPARGVLGGSAVVGAGLVVVGAGVASTTVPLAGFGLVLTGLGISTWDVSMNVEGADVERRLDRPMMPRFHAGFSLGSVAGALIGAALAAAHVPAAVQFTVLGLVTATATAVTVRWFLPAAGTPAGAPAAAGRSAASAWWESRTLLVGVLVLGFALSEGAANDWLTLALTDGHHTSPAVGAVGLGFFVAAMTLARAFGGALLPRWGRPATLRASAALGMVGLLLVVAGPTLAVVLPGIVCWGVGTGLGFPVGMSSAADDPQHAAARVATVSSIGYTAFLVGPPLVGFLGQSFGILRALLVVLAALAVGVLAAGSTRPATRTRPATPARP